MSQINVFLAEGENHVREALRLILDHDNEIAVNGEAVSAESLLVQICQRPSDVILLDWNLPGLHPQRLVTVLRRFYPETIILVMCVRSEQGKTAMEYGIDAYLLKQLPPDQFIAALKEAYTNLSAR